MIPLSRTQGVKIDRCNGGVAAGVLVSSVTEGAVTDELSGPRMSMMMEDQQK